MMQSKTKKLKTRDSITKGFNPRLQPFNLVVKKPTDLTTRPGILSKENLLSHANGVMLIKI